MGKSDGGQPERADGREALPEPGSSRRRRVRGRAGLDAVVLARRTHLPLRKHVDDYRLARQVTRHRHRTWSTHID